MNKRPSLRTVAIFLATLWLPLTYLVSNLTAAYLKTTNPSNVDVTQGLAYLREAMVVGFSTAGIIIAATVYIIVKIYRIDRNFINAKLPIVLLVASVGIMIITLATSSYIGSVEENYRQTQSVTNQ